MKVLLVRLSSLGDVLHTLPALTDLQAARGDVLLDWLIEPAFAPVASWHPVVRRSWEFSLRQRPRGGKELLRAVGRLRRELRAEAYDLALDSQGLYKSAFLAHLAGARVAGLSTRSAREPLASYLYGQRHVVPWGPTAIQRNRELFAQVFAYPRPAGAADYGLASQIERWRGPAAAGIETLRQSTPFVLGFHATSRAWQNKEWPANHWVRLAQRLGEIGYRLLLPAVDERERLRVESITMAAPNVQALPTLNLEDLGRIMVAARAFVGMDTGLSYLAAALGLPGVTLYGPTAPEQASRQITVLQSAESCAPCGSTRCRRIATPEEPIPCQESLLPERVWAALAPLLAAP
ncbi:lipopolysaccharide heptosyltransferase I [Acidithiobacillus sp. AMEEHan]|uniref:lipopolysaccharide heptosyltransferase I n=1 Tax=Acidithiobacillus sp. AMEEHan TaxID=2994951 RepID=UPI0027E54304|nr:lipopolysaccharide heptosyltransferase I [Acidithiobacillus sp. AMEEHan]